MFRPVSIRMTLLTACITLVASVPVAVAGPVVVVHKDFGVSKMSPEAVKNVYLGKTTKLADGTKIEFVILAAGDVSEAFFSGVVGKTPSQFLGFWRKQVFSGQGTLPKEFADEKSLLEYVARTPGAMGYVGEGADLSTVKQLTVGP